MKKALVIASKDLKLRLRDRSAIVLAFIAPLVLATIINFAFGRGDIPFNSTIAYADLDGSDVSTAFIGAVNQVPAFKESLRLKKAASAEAVRALVNDEKANAGWVIPKGFAEGVRSSRAVEIRVVRSSSSPISGEVALTIAEGFVDEINAGRLAVRTAVSSGALARSGMSIQALVDQAVTGRIPAGLEDGSVGTRKITPSSYFAPAMAIFFLFFTSSQGALGLLAERREGTLKRLLATPTRGGWVVTGKVLSTFVLGMLSMSTMIVASGFLLKAKWGDPLAVMAVTISIVFAVMGVTAMIVALSRTMEQAQAFSSVATMILALLGGNFIPLNDAPAFVQKLSRFTPNGWALRSYYDLAAEGGGIATVLTGLWAMVLLGAVAGAIAILAGRRVITR